MERRHRVALLLASPLLVLSVVSCGTAPRPSPSVPSGYVDPPMAETADQAVTFYLDAVKHRDCSLAEQYTMYEFHSDGDLCEQHDCGAEYCGGPTLGGLAFDAWRFDPSVPTRKLGRRVYMYAVELHITKHSCAGSICSNGWHTWFLQVRGEQPGNGYLLEAGGSGP
jgi:hypothetical protein